MHLIIVSLDDDISVKVIKSFKEPVSVGMVGSLGNCLLYLH